MSPTNTPPPTQNKISTCLWFPTSALAKDAANFYTSIFPSSKITHVQHYTEAGRDQHRQTPGDIMVISYTLLGGTLQFVNLNGGSVPGMQFTPGISFQIDCDDQGEVDYYWGRLKEGGNEERQQCGWVEDKFGVSWQVVPRVLKDMLADAGNPAGVARATVATMGMGKLDVEALRRAFEGSEGGGE